ncbi:hypothetical protein ASF41_21570 [Methylobacterium sp. Leaf111]|nr:hypothetical protein ASF41_21570 [Methylobacterium sp. Leaf111]
MIPTADRWGPFTPDLDPPERITRCRCLRAVVHLTTGPRGDTATRLLYAADRDPAALPEAARALNAMAPIDKRQVWASYARLAASERSARSMRSKLAVSNIVRGMR